MIVKVRYAGHVAVISLEDRSRRNALSRDIIGSALAALEETRGQGSRAIVVTGYDTTFSAGADIADLLDAGWMTGEAEGATPYQLFSALEDDPRPIFAAVNGLALGGGFELAMCCDLVFASEGAKFMLPELGLGVIPNTGLAKLRRFCGEKVAADLVLTRRSLTADEACKTGIVSRVFSTDELIGQTIDAAARLAETTPPSALAVAKRALRQPAASSWPEIEALLLAIDPREWREGLGAFVEKRKPVYDEFWTGGGR